MGAPPRAANKSAGEGCAAKCRRRHAGYDSRTLGEGSASRQITTVSLPKQLVNHIESWSVIHRSNLLFLLGRCISSTKCGSNNFCVGFEVGRVYCYGSTLGCLWGQNDCTSDSDCYKYSLDSPKFTDGDSLVCPSDSSEDTEFAEVNVIANGWRADACTCKTPLHCLLPLAA